MQGLVKGLEPSATRSQRDECVRTLRGVTGPVSRFMWTVADGCSKGFARCRNNLSMQLIDLSNQTALVHTRIAASCPAQLGRVVTASRDPFFMVNTVALALLHSTGLHDDVRQMLYYFVHDSYSQFGYYFGRALQEIVPLVRLPLKREELNELIRGLVQSFTREDPSPDADGVPAGGGAGNGSALNLTEDAADAGLARKHQLCLAHLQAQFGPLNGALEQLAGSLLNATCMHETLRFQGPRCVKDSFSGVISFMRSLHSVLLLDSGPERQMCPKGLIRAMDRFNDKAALILNFGTNLVERSSSLEDLVSAMDAFYASRFYEFGLHMGAFVESMTAPSFRRVHHLPFAGLGLPLRAGILALMAPGLFVASAAALVCLFPSSLWGWPSEHQEVIVTSPEQADLSLSHEFFGGQLPLGSEVEFVAEARLGPQEVSSGEDEDDEEQGNCGSQLQQLPCGSSDDEAVPTNDRRFSCMWRHALEIHERATCRVRLTLTDELPPMPAAQLALRATLGLLVPCLAGGQRRWKVQIFERRDGEWCEASGPSSAWDQVSQWAAASLSERLLASPTASSSGSSSPSSSASGLLDARELLLTPSMRSFQVGQGDDSACCAAQLAAPLPFIETQTFLNFQRVRPPVPDRPAPTTFAVHHVRSLSLQLKPARRGTECWDLLLVIAALVQLLEACWQLFLLLLLGVWDVLFEGEVLTLWLQWARMASAVLVLHKKYHAIWFAAVRDSDEMRPEESRPWWCSLLCFQRTPTPVPLLSEAPAVRSPTRPWLRRAYRLSHHMEEGDTVRVASPHHSRSHSVGVLRSSVPDEQGRLCVDFGDGPGFLAPEELKLDDDDARARRMPVWQDKLTHSVWLSTLVLWIATAVCLLVFSDRMADKEGRLVICLQAPKWRDPFSGWSFGFVACLQLACILLEALIRSCTWLLRACTMAAYYGSRV